MHPAHLFTALLATRSSCSAGEGDPRRASVARQHRITSPRTASNSQSNSSCRVTSRTWDLHTHLLPRVYAGIRVRTTTTTRIGSPAHTGASLRGKASQVIWLTLSPRIPQEKKEKEGARAEAIVMSTWADGRPSHRRAKRPRSLDDGARAAWGVRPAVRGLRAREDEGARAHSPARRSHGRAAMPAASRAWRPAAHAAAPAGDRAGQIEQSGRIDGWPGRRPPAAALRLDVFRLLVLMSALSSGPSGTTAVHDRFTATAHATSHDGSGTLFASWRSKDAAQSGMAPGTGAASSARDARCAAVSHPVGHGRSLLAPGQRRRLHFAPAGGTSVTYGLEESIKRRHVFQLGSEDLNGRTPSVPVGASAS
ncbi:hypothetical protein PHLGIDRAFT_117102 [Phlebiopsis gigantea 11061_1 CR5-6]|uniref:Amidohydrolase-related domain-containing protein n=1 Tax=Phlebiopsis gigantea (strain 11061_1 CR5-6) TaxID=745531 RepID=A0A0C3S0U1_PHLG1|nr:hypothetical protein PHLGIDRAFT_117102 [Phlebiopsis gigantea 11061_1 CR5-6]